MYIDVLLSNGEITFIASVVKCLQHQKIEQPKFLN